MKKNPPPSLYPIEDPVAFMSNLAKKPESYWIERGEKNALHLFHSMAERVPAYKNFLKKNQINARLIKTINDFRKLPLIDKNNYLRAYSLEELNWDGNLEQGRNTFSATSGSTGEPFYFPRQVDQDKQYAAMAEMYLRTNFNIHKKSTLYIDCFAMGAWIGGVFTFEAIRLVAERGKYPLSIITPGIFKEEIFAAIKKLSSHFDQVIIGGYPPFVKDIIDEGIQRGIDWKKYPLGGFVFSAEGFSETFRDYILEKTGHTLHPFTSTLNHYGTVDLGTMSYETPLSVLLRRVILQDKNTYESVFGQTLKLPTLTQFFPEMFFFEQVAENVVCSAFGGLPLVRYDLKDHGGVFGFSQMLENVEKGKIRTAKEIAKAGIKQTVWRLPFVYVYERDDFSASFYGANIYPETIRKVLQAKVWQNLVSGKCTLMVQYDNRQNPFLEINIELKKGKKASIRQKKVMQDACTKLLLEENSEYRSNYERIGQKVVPRIVFWEHGSPSYFRAGAKQKWVME